MFHHAVFVRVFHTDVVTTLCRISNCRDEQINLAKESCDCHLNCRCRI